MKEKLAQIKAEAIKQIENSRTLEQLNEVRVSQLDQRSDSLSMKQEPRLKR